MRKLKLQMQVSADGMVEAQTGSDRFNWDEEVKQYSTENAAKVDCILLGAKTALGFIPHWKSVADNPNNVDCAFGGLLTGIPKIVFSKTIEKLEWPNVTIARGEIVEQVNLVKNQTGEDMLVYGGSSFAASLIKHDLIDEYHLLVNPILFGNGVAISRGLPASLRLSLLGSKAFSCGTVLLCYKSLRA
jgi:dihydrofolate reductase